MNTVFLGVNDNNISNMNASQCKANSYIKTQQSAITLFNLKGMSQVGNNDNTTTFNAGVRRQHKSEWQLLKVLLFSGT